MKLTKILKEMSKTTFFKFDNRVIVSITSDYKSDDIKPMAEKIKKNVIKALDGKTHITEINIKFITHD